MGWFLSGKGASGVGHGQGELAKALPSASIDKAGSIKELCSRYGLDYSNLARRAKESGRNSAEQVVWEVQQVSGDAWEIANPGEYRPKFERVVS